MVKKYKYKIGEHIEFKTYSKNKKGFINRIRVYFHGIQYHTVDRKGHWYSILEEDIIRKLPILRDKNGRFTRGIDLSYHSGPLNVKKVIKRADEIQDQAEKWHKNDCSCFNCDKCAEQMRAYYKRTGELKPMGKIPKEEIDKAVKLVEENIKLTEEKKPSERIEEVAKIMLDENPLGDVHDLLIAAILVYLDEQFKKNK